MTEKKNTPSPEKTKKNAENATPKKAAPPKQPQKASEEKPKSSTSTKKASVSKLADKPTTKKSPSSTAKPASPLLWATALGLVGLAGYSVYQQRASLPERAEQLSHYLSSASSAAEQEEAPSLYDEMNATAKERRKQRLENQEEGSEEGNEGLASAIEEAPSSSQPETEEETGTAPSEAEPSMPLKHKALNSSKANTSTTPAFQDAPLSGQNTAEWVKAIQENAQLKSNNNTIKRQLEQSENRKALYHMHAKLYQLEQQALRGDDFSTLLEQLTALPNYSVIAPLLQPISSAEKKQLLTHKALEKEFKTALEKHLSAKKPSAEENATFWDQTLQNLGSVVTIRKVGANQKGDDDEAIIARAEAHLKSSNCQAALSELEALSPEAGEAFARFHMQAQQRIEAKAAFTAAHKALSQAEGEE